MNLKQANAELAFKEGRFEDYEAWLIEMYES